MFPSEACNFNRLLWYSA